MAESAPIPYHCLIGTASGSLLLLPAGDGRWALPTLSRAAAVWLPYDVAAIGRLVRERYGVQATVLRHLRDEKAYQACELEVHGQEEPPPEGSRWFERQALAGVTLASDLERDLLAGWLREKESGRVPESRPPWERPGWLVLALHWIRAQLARLNYVATGPFEPVKLAWSGSAILRIPTTAGYLYFKAAYRKPPSEAAMIQALGERYPRSVPRIVACDLQRRWVLMADFEGRVLNNLPAEWWPGAARRFAEIQRECAADLHLWSDLGCPDRTRASVVDLWRRMLADRAGLTTPRRGLRPAEIASLQALTPRLEAVWGRLEECGIPPSLHHEDFHTGNVAAVGEEYLFLDWGDCVIAHPFFSIQRMLDFISPPQGVAAWDGRLEHPEDDLRRRIRDAYLEGWTAQGSPAQLREAFLLSRYLNDAYQAVRWYLEAAWLEPGSPWHQRVVGNYLRQLRAVLALTNQPGV